MGVQVENYVVGAPCGVMDQMASSLGDQQALMAMSCQPAEVEPEVPIPSHLKFWGLDSGESCYAFLSVCVSGHPIICLPICLPACLSVCLNQMLRVSFTKVCRQVLGSDLQ
jgi:hypothetical protein